MKSFAKKVAAASVALACASFANAAILIDPDGTGALGSIEVGGLDWAASSVLIAPTGRAFTPGGIGLGGTNAATPGAGDILQSFAHASLSSFTNANGDALGVNGLNSDFQWTFVSGFNEAVTNFAGSPGLATIKLDTLGAGLSAAIGGQNFFRVYAGTAINSNSLTGQGYNDGTLIMEGVVLPRNLAAGRGETTFTTTGIVLPDGSTVPNIQALDKFGPNNYAATQSVTGQGSGTVDVQATFVNTDYFTFGFNPGDILSLFLDTQLNDPFSQVNPSSCFTNQANVTNIVGAGDNGQPGDCGPVGGSIGPINGITGPNFMLQSDATSTFVVPEPGSLALLGLSFGLLGLSRRAKAPKA